jgi:hypothetical protein
MVVAGLDRHNTIHFPAPHNREIGGEAMMTIPQNEIPNDCRNTEEGWRTLVLAAARNCGEARQQLRGEDMAFLPYIKPGRGTERVDL